MIADFQEMQMTVSTTGVRLTGVATAMLGLAALAGCTQTDPGQRDRVLQNAPDPVGEARSLLQSYASGSPMGSEGSMFDDLVARVKAADPAKGEALAAFIADIQKSPAGLAGKAKKVLESF
jgi:hypothetical protein